MAEKWEERRKHFFFNITDVPTGMVTDSRHVGNVCNGKTKWVIILGYSSHLIYDNHMLTDGDHVGIFGLFQPRL